MPFRIIRNDITAMQVDAIVNTANPEAAIGAGTDYAIHKAAGPKLFAAREKIGSIAVGEAAITPGYQLPAKYVIHAVSPIWQGGTQNEAALLRQCYTSALRIAKKNRLKSVAFPLLASGSNGFPEELALETAVSAFRDFLETYELLIYLVVFDKKAFRLSGSLFEDVVSYVDENYVEESLSAEYRMDMPSVERRMDCSSAQYRNDALFDENRPNLRYAKGVRGTRKGTEEAAIPMESIRPLEDANCIGGAKPDRKASGKQKAVQKRSEDSIISESISSSEQRKLEELLKHTDAGFSETLLKLIDRTGKKDSEIYKKINVDRKLFSKIRNNPDYRPSKATALAFSFALELNLEEAKDLLARAGFALSRSSKLDVIAEYFLEHRNYDLYTLNELLFYYDQPLIGV